MRMKYRVHTDDNSKTKLQWAKLRRVPFRNGEWMYHNGYRQSGGMYYVLEDTRKMSNDEWKAYREPLNKKARERYERQSRVRLKNKYISKINEIEAESVINPSGVICFDIETTGLNSYEDDEILQFSAIDGDGNILLNTYIKPYAKNSWKEAERVNGITTEMVSEAPYLHELASKIKGIFETAKVESIAYNGNFDLEFLANFGIEGHMTFDVMEHFAPIYGEWSEYYGNYKWQKLTTCAEYYGYEFKAHDSLEDVNATLYCYNKILEQE